ncbi:hypothetical protein [Maricaulis maris]|uniref:hypothetical protein n=1 Tax=Maricaulis maris TaxID=74318 RepID=UPI003B8E64CD
MRYIGIALSLLILAGTGALVWQDGLTGNGLVVRAPATTDLATPARPLARPRREPL